MEIKRAAIKSLKFAGHNPKLRTSKDSPQLKVLAKSMQTIGLIYPVAITGDNCVIDGHRRIVAAKKLGWDEIPAIVVACDNPDAVYAEVNAAASPHNSRERFAVWFKNPNAVMPRSRSKFEAIENRFGRQLISRALDHGYGPLLFRISDEVAKYVGRADDVAFATKCVAWVMKHKNNGVLRTYLSLHQSPRSLYQAVCKGRDLRQMVKIS